MTNLYRKKGFIEAELYMGQSLEGVSVSSVDNPANGGYIATNPDNPKDRWFVAMEYFQKHYEKVE